jgi:hypothetical protein
MNILKTIFRVFIYVIASITICAAVCITIFFPEDNLLSGLLWKIICMAAVCACGNIIYLSKKELNKKQHIFRTLLHYLYINVVVIGVSILWGWIATDNVWNFIVMFLLIGVVFFSIMAFMFKQDKLMAENMNKKLRQYNQNEDGD